MSLPLCHKTRGVRVARSEKKARAWVRVRVGVSVGDVVGVVVVEVLWRRCDDVCSCRVMSGCDGGGDRICLLYRRCDWRGLGCGVISGSGLKFVIGEQML